MTTPAQPPASPAPGTPPAAPPAPAPAPAAPPAAPAAAPPAPAPAAPAPTPAPGAPAPEPPDDGAQLHLTTSQLNQRLDRAGRKALRDAFGTDDPAEIEKIKNLRDQEEQRRREAMTREQQLQTDLEAANQRATTAEEERDAIQFEAHVSGICARLGVRNVDYAMHMIGRAADDVAEGEQLDAEDYLRTQLENAQQAAALGVEQPPVQTPTPATTSPTPGRPPAAPPGPGGGNPPQDDAFGMDEGQWRQRRAALGLIPSG